MKNKIITLLTAFMMTAGLMFANTGKAIIPETIVSEFSNNFSTAKDAHWETFGAYFKVTFVQDSKTLYAFYTYNADFIGIGENVSAASLPVQLTSDIKTKYATYWITSLAKYQAGDRDGYIVTLENGDQKIVLKTDDNEHWQLFDRVNKS